MLLTKRFLVDCCAAALEISVPAALDMINCLLFMGSPHEFSAAEVQKARWKATLFVLIVFLLNIWIVRELLTAEFVDQMGSIEGTHIALGRFALENGPNLRWFPWWYGGIPFQNAYPPLHPLLVAAVAGVTGLTAAHAYHSLTAVLYSLGPIALFFLALRISRSLPYSFAAAVLYSLISPSNFLSTAVRNDGGLWHARRLQALVQYGEGPHIAALTLIPLVLLLLVVAFEKRRPAWWFLAALGLASVPLTNWLGSVALASGVAAWLFSMPDDNRFWNWTKALALAVWAYAIACPGLPPSTILTVRRNEPIVSSPVSAPSLRWACAAAVVLLVVLLLRLFRRYKVPQELRFSVLYLIPMATLTLTAEWFRIFLMPQPQRYHLEMEMGIALVAAFGAKRLLERAPQLTRVVVACALLVLCIYPAKQYRRYARNWLDRHIDIHSRIEYREARWFDQHMDGHRVFAPGSVGFFLNVFTDTPQLNGGFDQGVVNYMLAVFRYQIMSGENAGAEEGPAAVLALKAFGMDAVGVSGPRSQEVYKPFRNPKKFDGILPELWRDGDDVIYGVPRRSKSLAHVIRPGDLPPRVPVHGLDLDPVRHYVSALEDPALPVAEMNWRTRHSAVISAQMQKAQILSVQISYHPGWRATVNGARRRTFEDHLGQMTVEPQCDGACTVELNYDGGREMRIARWLSWSALGAGILWIVNSEFGRRFRKRRPTTA